MSKRSFPISIMPTVNSLAKNFGLEKEIAAGRLQARWREVVGPGIAAHTHPIKIRFGTLYLLVDSAVWLHQLSFLKQELIEKTNRFFGESEIRNLRLRSGPLPPSSEPPDERLEPGRPCTEEETAYIETQTASLADPVLKETIRKALRRHLTRRDSVGEPARKD